VHCIYEFDADDAREAIDSILEGGNLKPIVFEDGDGDFSIDDVQVVSVVPIDTEGNWPYHKPKGETSGGIKLPSEDYPHALPSF